jgi:hypothetical protein
VEFAVLPFLLARVSAFGDQDQVDSAFGFDSQEVSQAGFEFTRHIAASLLFLFLVEERSFVY